MSRVILESMTCVCGRGCISVRATDERGGTRITEHKCTGEWMPVQAYVVNAERAIKAIMEAAAPKEEKP